MPIQVFTEKNSRGKYRFKIKLDRLDYFAKEFIFISKYIYASEEEAYNTGTNKLIEIKRGGIMPLQLIVITLKGLNGKHCFQVKTKGWSNPILSNKTLFASKYIYDSEEEAEKEGAKKKIEIEKELNAD